MYLDSLVQILSARSSPCGHLAALISLFPALKTAKRDHRASLYRSCLLRPTLLIEFLHLGFELQTMHQINPNRQAMFEQQLNLANQHKGPSHLGVQIKAALVATVTAHVLHVQRDLGARHQLQGRIEERSRLWQLQKWVVDLQRKLTERPTGGREIGDLDGLDKLAQVESHSPAIVLEEVHHLRDVVGMFSGKVVASIVEVESHDSVPGVDELAANSLLNITAVEDMSVDCCFSAVRVGLDIGLEELRRKLWLCTILGDHVQLLHRDVNVGV